MGICKPPFGAILQLLILPRGRALLHHVFSLERLVWNQMMLVGCQWRFDGWHRILLEEGSVLSVRRCCQLHEGRSFGQREWRLAEEWGRGFAFGKAVRDIFRMMQLH